MGAITPALAGPFDPGTVGVREALTLEMQGGAKGLIVNHNHNHAKRPGRPAHRRHRG